MANDFYKVYAKYYDIINRNKSYTDEIKFMDDVFKKFNIKHILDVGCGTATHALLLEKKGYGVTGVDISGDMLKVAESKIKKAKSKIKLAKQDMRNLKFQNKFDAVLCMFHTLNHLPTNKDIFRAIKSANKVLRPKGLYLIDMGQYKIKNDGEHHNLQDSYKTKNFKLRVFADHIFSFKNQCQYTKWTYIIEKNGKTSTITSGIVNTKSISFREIRRLLSKAGFKFLSAHNNYSLKAKFNPAKDKHMIILCQKLSI